jgi:hypothetical protein
LLKGETDGLSLVSQYNPHGIFIALEALGYIMMSVAFLFAGVVFVGRDWVERALRWLFIAGFIFAVGSLIVLTLLYGNDLEYRFELAVISIDWLVLIISGVLYWARITSTRASRARSCGEGTMKSMTRAQCNLSVQRASHHMSRCSL